MRKSFSELMQSELESNKMSALLLGDISMGLFINEQEKLPERCFNVGILEQSMISVAAGLASKGMEPWVHTIAAFLIERTLEQIKLDLLYNQNKVILVSANGPYDYSKLGPTHHSANEVNVLNEIGLNAIHLPFSSGTLEKSFDLAKKNSSSVYIRLAKFSIDEFDDLPDFAGGKLLSKQKSDVLSILVGEAAQIHLDLCQETGDFLFVSDLNGLALPELTAYKEIRVWEPYGNPIIAPRIIAAISDVKVVAWCYPRSMESGIFDAIKHENRYTVRIR